MKLRLCVLAACFSSVGFSHLETDAPIPLVFGHSTTVFVGKVVTVHALPQRSDTAGRDWLVDFNPLRIYKCPIVPAMISVGYRDVDPAWSAPLTPGDVTLSFAGPAPVLGPGLFVVDDTTLAFELNPRAKDSADPDGLAGIEADALALGLGGASSAWMAKQAMTVLGRFTDLSSGTVNALMKHGPLDDPTCEELRVGLIAQSDPHTYLSSLAALLSAKTVTRDSNGFELGEMNAISLISRVIGQQSDAQDLAALEAIADGPSFYLRMISLDAMRRIKDPRAIDFLLNKLLTSADLTEAYEALMVLGETTGRLDLETIADDFNRQPAMHREAWEAWAKTDLAKFKDHPASYREISENWVHTRTPDTPQPNR